MPTKKTLDNKRKTPVKKEADRTLSLAAIEQSAEMVGVHQMDLSHSSNRNCVRRAIRFSRSIDCVTRPTA